MRLLQQAGEENSTGGAATDTTVPPVGEPKAGDPEPAQAPPPNPAERIQEQAERAVAANARPDDGVAQPPLLVIKDGGGLEVVRVEESGRMILRGVEVDSREKFREAMLAIGMSTGPVAGAAVNTVHEAATALMDGQEVVAAMRRSLIEFESALALGTHEIAHEARAFLAHCAEKLKRHIPS